MFIIVGLGNPGREYENTRHNVGFMTVDMLADRFNIEVKRHNFRAVFGEGYIGGQKVVLAKPETYMNLSGWSVMELCNWYKPEHDQLLLIYDDIDIPLGTIRIRGGGSSGTHNGMRDIVKQIGSCEFPRVRIGIGPKPEQWDIVDYVLSRQQNDADKKRMEMAYKRAAGAVVSILTEGVELAQRKYNVKKG